MESGVFMVDFFESAVTDLLVLGMKVKREKDFSNFAIPCLRVDMDEY